MDLDVNTSLDSNPGSTNGKQDAKKQQFTTKQRMDMYAFCVLELELHGNTVSIKKQQQAIQKALKREEKLRGSSILTLSANDSSNPQPDDSIAIDIHDPVEVVLDADGEAPVKSRKSAKRTLLQLKEEIAKNQRCYSDYQKTQVLTTSMLREVQSRFAKYYPDAPCPSRTTIKHVFLKCIENGTVENVKNPRKPTKIPNGTQIEQFLDQEPQISLREMAKRLNVSTGTVSRRCRALGIVPESVTLKHQQMAMAKRQKQMKQTKNRTKAMVMS